MERQDSYNYFRPSRAECFFLMKRVLVCEVIWKECLSFCHTLCNEKSFVRFSSCEGMAMKVCEAREALSSMQGNPFFSFTFDSDLRNESGPNFYTLGWTHSTKCELYKTDCFARERGIVP